MNAAGDPLAVEQQVHGDEGHQQQVEQGPEDPEDPAKNTRRHVYHLPGRRRVGSEQLQDSVLVELYDVLAHVRQPLRLVHQAARLPHEDLWVLDQALHLPNRGDDDHQQRHHHHGDEHQEHPDDRQRPRHPPPLEAPHYRVERVGEDAGRQEGQEDAAQLPHEGHQHHHTDGQQDVLQIRRGDQFFGGHSGSDSISTTRNTQAPRTLTHKFTLPPPLCIIPAQ